MTQSRRQTLHGVLLLLLGIVGVSTSSLWVRMSGDSAGELAFRRMLLVLPAIALWARWVRAPLLVPRRTALVTAVSAVLLGIHFWAWNASLARLPVATSLLLVNVHPVMVFVIEWGARRVRPRVPAVVGLLASICGMALLAWRSGGDAAGEAHVVGVLLALLGAAAIAGYLIVGRELRHSLPVPTYLFAVYGGAALFLGACLCFEEGASWLPLTAWEWTIALLLALLPTLLGHTPLNAALRKLPATVVSTAFLGEVVVASLLVWMVRGEVLPDRFWPGALLVVAGIVAVIHGVRARR
ncbi:MAG: DMT family transporter [Pseudomonadota bacterium]